MASASWRLVSRKVPMAGGTRAAMSAISASSITPGPVGMDDTSPSAEAPARTARAASSALPMQQILMRGFIDSSSRHGAQKDFGHQQGAPASQENAAPRPEIVRIDARHVGRAPEQRMAHIDLAIFHRQARHRRIMEQHVGEGTRAELAETAPGADQVAARRQAVRKH